jgi:hypothetical protein
MVSIKGYETWICELGKKSFVNLDVEVNERRVPLNQISKLIHTSMGYPPFEPWKLGCKKTEWTRPKWTFLRVDKNNEILSSDLLYFFRENQKKFRNPVGSSGYLQKFRFPNFHITYFWNTLQNSVSLYDTVIQ